MINESYKFHFLTVFLLSRFNKVLPTTDEIEAELNEFPKEKN
jgi:hypothetical protein